MGCFFGAMRFADFLGWLVCSLVLVGGVLGMYVEWSLCAELRAVL